MRISLILVISYWLLAIGFAQPIQAEEIKCCIINNQCNGGDTETQETCTEAKGFFDPECAHPNCDALSARGTDLIDLFGSKLGFSTAQPQEPEVIVGKVVQGLLVVIGAIFGVLIIYAGVRWMTARGNEETVKQAIETLQAAVIGFVVVVGAYAITAYVVGKVISAALTP